MKDYLIVTRRSENWESITWDEWIVSYWKKFNYSFSDEKIKAFRDRVALWNKDYLPTYFDYRSKIKSIARKSWELTGLEIVDLEDVNQFYRDVIYIPTDDDDWFCPDISEQLNDLSSDAVYWNDWKWCKNVFDQNGQVSSNGYVVPGSVAKKSLLEEHGFFKGFEKVDANLSLWLRHFGSWCYLSRDMSFVDINSQNLPKELSWAQPYWDEFCKIKITLNPMKIMI